MTVKAAALSAGYSTPHALFPEHIPAPDIDEVEAEAEANGEDVEYDYSDVKWQMPSDEDPEETLRLLGALGGASSLAIGEDEEFIPQPLPGSPGLDLEAEDREWL